MYYIERDFDEALRIALNSKNIKDKMKFLINCKKGILGQSAVKWDRDVARKRLLILDKHFRNFSKALQHYINYHTNGDIKYANIINEIIENKNSMIEFPSVEVNYFGNVEEFENSCIKYFLIGQGGALTDFYKRCRKNFLGQSEAHWTGKNAQERFKILSEYFDDYEDYLFDYIKNNDSSLKRNNYNLDFEIEK